MFNDGEMEPGKTCPHYCTLEHAQKKLKMILYSQTTSFISDKKKDKRQQEDISSLNEISEG